MKPSGGKLICCISEMWFCLISHGLSAVFDRDLKPTNVLLDEQDKPLLMDLGSMGRARIEVRALSFYKQ